MINTSLIIINNIEPVYECISFEGAVSAYEQIGLKVKFAYKNMEAEIKLNTRNIYGEEIKDLIVEALR